MRQSDSHTEIVQVYRYASTPDGFGGQTPITPIRQTLAPQWATIKPVSGNDIRVSMRLSTEYIFDVFVNWRSDFTWERDMFISSRFGFLDITNIVETGRKRGYRIEGRYIEGVSSTPAGGNLMRIYAYPEAGSTSILVPALAGNTVLLGFREGIEKEVVESGPQLNELAVDIDGNVSLVSGDIFAAERLAFLYQTI